MSADAASPPTREHRRPAEFREALAQTQRFTQSRIDRTLALVVGAGAAIIGVQSLLSALGEEGGDQAWGIGLLVAVMVPLALMCVSMLIGWRIRAFAGIFAVIFPIAVALWPLAAGANSTLDEHPWLWFLLNIGTVAAVFAFPLAWQIVWAFLVPIVYGVVRTVLLGVDPAVVADIVFDSVYAVILACVLIIIAWLLRGLAARIDEAREGAVRSYAQAAAADAVEKERVAVAALMHDSVLAALIAAERAESERERSLSVSMAREALTRLANVDREVGEGPDAPVAPAELVRDLEEAGTRLHPGLAFTAEIADDARDVPGRVARALQLAAMQAIANSVEHARAAGLRVAYRASAEGLEIRIDDDGPGFVADRVADDRLGIRASILARVAAVAGTATVDSDENGTSVALAWRERS